MSKSQIGVVIQYPHADVFEQVRQWRPESAVLIDLNEDLAKHLRVNGCNFLVARMATKPPMGNSVLQAYEHGKNYAIKYFQVSSVRNQLFDAIQTPVGYVDNNSDQHRHNLFASFQLGMLEGIAEYNIGKHTHPWGTPPERSLRLCAMNMFTGHGTSEMLTMYYSDVLNHPCCQLLGVQEYWWPSLFVEQTNTNVFRWIDMVANFPNISVYGSEVGLTQLVFAGWGGANPGDDGWLFPENNTPYDEIDTPLHKRYVLESMDWYNRRAREHPQYLGCAWYLLGPGEQQWLSHNVGSLAGEEFSSVEPEPEPKKDFTIMRSSDVNWMTFLEAREALTEGYVILGKIDG